MMNVIIPKQKADFVETPYITALVDRALIYLKLGYPVHLCGPTGCGKTTIAMHIASKLGKQVVMLNGNESVSSETLIGDEFGYKKKKLVDRYVDRVYKMEESMSKTWSDERLTSACKYGFTLIYNEFTRSRPEMNNVLLPVLEERILALPAGAYGGSYMKVHPDLVQKTGGVYFRLLVVGRN